MIVGPVLGELEPVEIADVADLHLDGAITREPQREVRAEVMQEAELFIAFGRATNQPCVCQPIAVRVRDLDFHLAAVESQGVVRPPVQPCLVYVPIHAPIVALAPAGR